MKVYEISYPDDKYGSITECYTEKGIIDSYYDDWVEKMIKAGKLHDLTIQNCIDDWIVVNWAVEVK